MNPKRMLTALLLIFVAGSLAYMVVRENSTEKTTASAPFEGPAGTVQAGGDSSGQDGAQKATPCLVVYYFHGQVRCPTCRKLESYAEEAIKTCFADELASGRIRWNWRRTSGMSWACVSSVRVKNSPASPSTVSSRSRHQCRR